jgi:hypothetical protein
LLPPGQPKEQQQPPVVAAVAIMDPGSPGLEDLGFLDLFGSQDKQTSMDLDSGLNAISLSELDGSGLTLNIQPSLRGYPGAKEQAECAC